MDYLNNPPAILNNRSYSLRRFAKIAKKILNRLFVDWF